MSFDHETLRTQDAEYERFQEILLADFDWIAIYGPSGTGKTTVGKILKNLYNIPFYKPSAQRRKIYERKTGEKIVDFDERTPLEDLSFDDSTRETMLARISDVALHAKRRLKPMIMEARLSGWITTQIEELAEISGEPKPRAVRVLMTAPLETQAVRILNRTNEETEKDNKQLPPNQTKRLLTYNEALEQTQNRDTKNNKAWHLAHGSMVGNPMDPNPQTKAQKHDLVVNTEKMSALQCAAFINDWLIKNGYVKKVPMNDQEVKLLNLSQKSMERQQKLIRELVKTHHK